MVLFYPPALRKTNLFAPNRYNVESELSVNLMI